MQVLDLRVPMRDGVELAADVVLLADGVPRPVLLVRTPYSRGAMRLVHDVVGLARSGWAVVVQDVRGRFDSGGRFTAFTQEVDDGFDTVDWCARAAWSDGHVVMTGWSYVGAACWSAATSGHSALRAVQPIVAAGDIDEAMLYEGGAFQVGLVQPWVLGLLASDPASTQAQRQRAGDLGARWPEVLRAAPGVDPVAELSATYADWRRRRPAVDGRTSSPVAVPAFQVAGWYDIFLESALRQWTANASQGVPQRLVIGPWSHSNGLSNLHPEIDFGGAANGVYGGVLGSALEWTRGVLRGDNVETGIRFFVMNEGWDEVDSWPPAATDLVLHLSRVNPAAANNGAGVLRPDPPPEPGRDELRHDPADPVPTRGGRVLGPFLPLPGPVDQRPVEQRSDVLVYTSEVLDQPLRVVGTVRAQVVVDSTGRSLDVAVKLSDVHPDGRSINVVDSIRRTDVVPGEPLVVPVELGTTAYVFPAGHRVRLTVAGSNFPRFDVNPTTGEAPGTARRLLPAVHGVHHGPTRGSTLHLPVRPLDAGVSKQTY